MDMLKTFLEIEVDKNGVKHAKKSNPELFNELMIRYLKPIDTIKITNFLVEND